ncbi:MAG: hypothetical protein ACP5SH_01075 [Syntrophobacteraceae bacterium]
MEHEKTLNALGATAFRHPWEVSPITREERCLWDRLMRENHYLDFRSMVGESLRYVAVHQGQWLAFLGWSAAAFSCKVRGQWIG